MRKLSIIASVIFLLFPALLSADTIYTYTGNPFTGFNTVTCPPVCSLTGWFSMTDPLPLDMHYTEVAPADYSFSDGVTTLTPGNSHLYTFGVSTDNGVITYWVIELGGQGAELQTHTTSGDASLGPVGTAGVGTHGTWTTGSPQVPEPSALLLLGTGLVGLAGALRRKLLG